MIAKQSISCWVIDTGTQSRESDLVPEPQVGTQPVSVGQSGQWNAETVGTQRGGAISIGVIPSFPGCKDFKMSLKNQKIFRPKEIEGVGRAFWGEGTACCKCTMELKSMGNLGANSGQGGRRRGGAKRQWAQRRRQRKGGFSSCWVWSTRLRSPYPGAMGSHGRIERMQ